MQDDDATRFADLEPRYEDRQAVSAIVDERDDGSRTCTLYPADAAVSERTTRWISADDGSFVDVENCR